MIWAQLIGLWIFSMIIYTTNRYYAANMSEDMAQKIKSLIASGAIEVEELTPTWVEGMLTIDMIAHSLFISILCQILYILLTA